ncbi:nuclear transport factor 2 family protein [candidate division KSB1 bacterium]
MKKTAIIFGIILLSGVFLYAVNQVNIEKEKQAVKKVIQDALVDGYLNDYDVEKMKKGIHPEFTIMELRNNELQKRGFSDLLDYVKKVKPERPNGRRVRVNIKMLTVDVIGNIGSAKVEFYVGDTHHGTDFITLMKFEDGWKLMVSAACEV